MPDNKNLMSTFSKWQQPSPFGYTIAGNSRIAIPTEQQIHLLHGTGFSGPTLATMASYFPKSWSLYLTDLPGHGRSEQPKHHMPDWQEMATAVYHAVKQQMAARSKEPLIGIGHSLGGVLTLMAAAEHPEFFKRVILLDPPIFNRPVMTVQKALRKTRLWQFSPMVKAVRNRQSFWQNTVQMQQYLAEKALYRHWHPQALEDFCQSASKPVEGGIRLACDPEWEGAIFGSYPRGLWNKIKRVGVKVDVITAQKSYPFIRPAVDKATRLNSCITVHNFGDRHCFPMEQPKESAEFIVDLLQT